MEGKQARHPFMSCAKGRQLQPDHRRANTVLASGAQSFCLPAIRAMLNCKSIHSPAAQAGMPACAIWYGIAIPCYQWLFKSGGALSGATGAKRRRRRKSRNFSFGGIAALCHDIDLL